MSKNAVKKNPGFCKKSRFLQKIPVFAKNPGFLQKQTELHSKRGLIISLIDLNFGI